MRLGWLLSTASSDGVRVAGWAWLWFTACSEYAIVWCVRRAELAVIEWWLETAVVCVVAVVMAVVMCRIFYGLVKLEANQGRLDDIECD